MEGQPTFNCYSHGKGAVIRNCYLGKNSKLHIYAGQVQIEDAYFGDNCVIHVYDKLKIGSGSIFSWNVSILEGDGHSLETDKKANRQVNYSASKAGVLALTKTLAKELGKYNISVNAICPGFIVTDLNRHNAEKKAIAQNNSSLTIDSSLEVLINFFVYMVSDKFINISGRTFNLDSRIF